MTWKKSCRYGSFIFVDACHHWHAPQICTNSFLLTRRLSFQMEKPTSRFASLHHSSKGQLLFLGTEHVFMNQCRLKTTGSLNKVLDRSDPVLLHFRQNKLFSDVFVQTDHVHDGQLALSGTGDLLEKLVKQRNSLNGKQSVTILSSEELKLLLLGWISRNEPKPKPEVLQKLDNECCKQVLKWTLSFSLYIHDALFLIAGTEALQTKFSKTLLSLWSVQMRFATRCDLIHIVYILGRHKLMPKNLAAPLFKKIESLSEHFAAEEWPILCENLFKAKAKITSLVILSKVVEATHQAVIKGERSCVIALCKALRHAEHYDKELWEKLATFVKSESSSLNTVECSHFLATFTNSKVYDQPLYSCLEKQIHKKLLNEEHHVSLLQKRLSKVHPSLRSRTKDMARIAWSFAAVNHSPSSDFLALIAQETVKKIQEEGFKGLDRALDCLCSLAVLGYYPKNLISLVLNPAFLSRLQKIEKDKPSNQLNLLISSVKIEKPDLKFAPPPPALLQPSFEKSLYREIKTRRGFETLLDVLVQGVPKGVVHRPAYILSHLAIASVDVTYDEQLKSQRKISIEIGDDSVYLRNVRKLCGIMEMKIRQLQILGYQTVLLSSEYIEKLAALPQDEKQESVKHILTTAKHFSEY